MRRLYRILLVIFVIGFVLLCLYAFVDPIRDWMKVTIGPIASDIFGGIALTITESWIWQQYIIPFPNQLIIGAVVLGFPIAWLVHKNFNWVRSKAVRSAGKESGIYPTMTEPISTPTYQTQPSTKTESTPQPKATTEPVQEPSPTQES